MGIGVIGVIGMIVPILSDHSDLHSADHAAASDRQSTAVPFFQESTHADPSAAESSSRPWRAIGG